MRRYHITLGALTTAGGQVVSASGNGSIDDKRVVVEGDIITCPACKSSGYVLCIGARIPEFWGEGAGKPVALENDLCICKCSNPPRLIANQSLRAQTIEGVAGMSEASYFHTALNHSDGQFQAGQFDDRYAIKHPETGKLLANRAYALLLSDGEMRYGTSDGSGKTDYVQTGDAPAIVELYIEGA